MIEIRPRPMVSSSQTRVAAGSPQRGRLMLALVLLLVALVSVVVKDREFWFGSDVSDMTADAAATTSTVKPVAKPLPNEPARPHTASLATKKQAVVAGQTSAAAVAPTQQASTVTRTVLPPLDVEVVAGDNHSKVRPNAAKVEVVRGDSLVPSAFAATTNAAERERLSTEGPQANYPLLAQHMNVQGSVVLQAMISADGIIENLHVLSGPAILAPAAQQAVREWRFKPVIQNGQAVETKARITVNFSIKVGEAPTVSAAGF